jgi:hypothetical protein
LDFDRLVDNRSPMAVRAIPMADRHGRDVMVVIAKLTYEVSPIGAVSLAHPPSPVRTSDELVGGSAWSSIRYPSDLVDEKPGTDVALVGTAHPPEGATAMDVSVRVETGKRTLFKAVRVHGRRVYYRGALGLAPGPAEPLGPTPLVYELAYGGVDDTDPNDIRIDRRNPSGMGFTRDSSRLVGTPAAVIEDPAAPIGARNPVPAGLGPIAANWEPRVSRAGTYDAAWRRDRAPVPPVDRDPRFNCFAPSELYSEVPLVGDESVEVLGATPSSAWRFRLPPHGASFRFVVRGVETEQKTHLDTYLIDANRRRVELVWRASVLMPRRVGYLESIVVGLSPQLPDAMFQDLSAKIARNNSEGVHS